MCPWFEAHNVACPCHSVHVLPARRCAYGQSETKARFLSTTRCQRGQHKTRPETAAGARAVYPDLRARDMEVDAAYVKRCMGT